MKILIINRYFCEISAVETLSWKTFQYLKEKGHDVYFFATDKKPYYIEDYEYSKYFPKDRFNTIEYLKNPISYYWDFDAAKKLEELISVVKPDIAHINQHITISVIKTLKKHNIPIVWTLHDTSIICPASTLKTGKNKYCKEFHCKNSEYYNCIKYRCQNNQLEPSIRKTIKNYLNKITKINEDIDLFITPSYALRKKILESNLKIDEKKIQVVNNFVNIKENIAEKVLNKDSYFLFVGRLVEEKGVQVLLEAMKTLPKEIKLKIAGIGNFEKELKDYVKHQNLTNVEFVGYVKQEQIDTLFPNAIATIVPSTMFDNFPTTTLESHANATAVIGADIGGITEQIIYGTDGYTFPTQDSKELAEKINFYWQNLEIAKEHGLNGYKKAKQMYTEDIYHKKISLILEELKR